ncbi:benzoate/H(+) symporter BenE family transporter [Bacillus sp. B15-48]|uniref:benzoate/H(+) symporter BenE family transporter n=1 Tax=Bacillus sp. B15-48 TaxID=1548601 RepID=UPI00193EFA55|nr:benzoate/H(+) symporter BenE family transporter [Bacillus sp. B15-48]MBM4763643.1 benzoate/H(+) symporter BenE family transporter [Bacillus sp. B15-48]
MESETNAEKKVFGQKTNHHPLKDLNVNNVSSGMISGMLAMTGPPAIILEAASVGQFTPGQTISWMFAVYFFGGLFGIIFPLLYKIPITGAHSISGVAFLVTMTPLFSFSELVGAYLLSGAIMFIIGISGLFTKIMKWFPKETIAAMLGGLITTYVVRLVSSVNDLAVVGIPALISFFIFTKWIKRVPAVLGAVAVALVTVLVTQDIQISPLETQYVLPSVYMPEFSTTALLTISLPLTLLVLSNDAAPGIGALQSTRFNPPIKSIISAGGLFSMLAGFFGGQSANVAGMMSAICSGEESGPRNKRYMAAVVSGVVILLFGIFAWAVVPFIQALPISFVSMLAGFALIGVLGTSLQAGFSNQKYRLSSTFTFAIALSNISFFHISAPVVALLVGAFIAKFIEQNKE